MPRRKESPEPRANAASGRATRTREERGNQTAQRRPFSKSLILRNGKGETIHITADTRLADVVLKLAAAGETGVSALDFPAGVRLGGLIFKLRRMGIGIETHRQKVAGDPFGMCIAVYRLAIATA
jgi:hypothetical protein